MKGSILIFVILSVENLSSLYKVHHAFKFTCMREKVGFEFLCLSSLITYF